MRLLIQRLAPEAAARSSHDVTTKRCGAAGSWRRAPAPRQARGPELVERESELGAPHHSLALVASDGRGFTLLELLLATAVSAIVLIVIQTTFFSALRLHHTTHARIDSDLVVQRALGIVRRDFAGLMLPGGVMSGQLQTTTFTSTIGADFGERVSPDLFTNSGRIDGWNSFSEVQMVAYYLAPSSTAAAGKDLVRVVTRNLLPVQETPGEPQVLLHGVDEAVVEFCDGTGWTQDWDSEVMSALPTAIKLRLGLAAPQLGQPRPEPFELIVPVFVTTSASARAAAANRPEEILP